MAHTFYYYGSATVRPSAVVFICTQDPVASSVYARHLEAYMFSVKVFASIADLCNTLPVHTPHVLLIGLSGEDADVAVLARIRALLPSLPVVAMGFGQTEAAVDRLMGLGLSGYVDRKFSRPRDVALLVKQILEPEII